MSRWSPIAPSAGTAAATAATPKAASRARRRSGISRKARRRGSSHFFICCRIRTRRRQVPPCDICVPAARRRSRRTTRWRPTAARRLTSRAEDRRRSPIRTSPRRSPSDRPIIAERAMYLNTAGPAVRRGTRQRRRHRRGHQLVPRGRRDRHVLRSVHPDRQSEQHRRRACRPPTCCPDGGTLQKTYDVGANSRSSIYVDAELFDGQPLLASTPMSVKLVSVNDVPVIVERTMWWPDERLVRIAQRAGLDADRRALGAGRG